ncbi:RNA polymerase sigma factor [Massilibacteroides vaginae]|uniref:RNA polymerase sigma factor n=1 Tax=Massilibacteroides vaginae TaxID=1673718 RepID=UPI000A1CB0ED|nr:sigma-70 family RNA polymerase sigma factor [Massilibacteroides vaginae]
MLTKKNQINDDQQIWDKFRSGDDKSYTYFYKKYVMDLFSYGLHFTPNRELVKDCIQDVFVKIYCNRSKLSTTDNVKLYLFIALKNTLFNVFQKDNADYHIDTLEPVFTIEFSIEDKLIREEVEEEQSYQIDQMLETLTPRQKEVVYYRYIEGMEMREVCLLMNMNYQSVQNLIQRSFKKIRTVFPSKKISTLSVKNRSRCV